MLLELLDSMNKRVCVPYDNIDMITEDNQGNGYILLKSGVSIETSMNFGEVNQKFQDAIAQDIEMLFEDPDEEF